MKHLIGTLIPVIAFSLTAVAGESVKTVKLVPEQPKMRPVDRSWEYFKKVPCEEVKHLVFHSRSEEILVAKRKSQCTNKYDAFFSKPVER